jgi:hypothetical protein
MRHSNTGRFRRQVQFLRRQFLQDGDLPFTDVLSEGLVSRALTAVGVAWRDRVFSPLVTLWVFLRQVLSADHSCRAAVARLLAHRISQGQSPCSAETGACCQARKRLPEKFFSAVARQTGRTLDDSVDPRWLWKRRRVYVYDGSSVSMPDTPANQSEYPQPVCQKPGLGFPLARIAAVFSLACGAVVELGICRYAGKGQSELGLLRTLWDMFRPGDVLLADRLMCAWTEMVMLKQRGVDSVTRLSKRTADFRRGERLGKDDHIVKWLKPTKPRSIDRETYDALPEFLTVREVCVQVQQPGFRVQTIIVATTLLDAKEISKDDLGQFYRARECGAGPQVAETDAADGRAAVQDAGAGPQGVVDAHPGLQPHPYDHGPGGEQAWDRAAVDQRQGCGPDAGSIPTRDCPARSTRRGLPHGALPAVTGCRRQPSGR